MSDCVLTQLVWAVCAAGGSGAGKTTLMDVLCGRKTVGEVQGDIWVNGHPKQQESWSRVVGYVEQNDIPPPGRCGPVQGKSVRAGPDR